MIVKMEPENLCVSENLVWLDTKLGFTLFGQEPKGSRCLKASVEKSIGPEENWDGLKKFFDYDRDELKKDDEIGENFTEKQR